MVGDTPAKIKHIINEAVIKAHFDGRDAHHLRGHLLRPGRPRVGPAASRSAMMLPESGAGSPTTKRATWWLQMRLLPHHRVVKATIVRHGPRLGFA